MVRRASSRKFAAAIGGVALSCIFYVYANTSVKAAKRNAERHRTADGGQINWRNESLRRHGALQKPEDEGFLRKLFTDHSNEKSSEHNVNGKTEPGAKEHTETNELE